MFRFALALGIALGIATAAASSHSAPTDVNVRLAQRADYGSKIKVKYTINSPETSIVQVRIGDDTIVDGATCGGYPYGCAVLRIAEPAWVWDAETFAMSLRVDDGPWSSPVRYRVDASTKGTEGIQYLEKVQHDEL